MENVDNFLTEFTQRKTNYDHVCLKGAFVNFENRYYPIKAFFVANKRNNKKNKPQYLDYGNLLLVNDCLSLESMANIAKNMGEDTQFELNNYKFTIPKSIFRSLDEARQKLQETYGFYSPLNDNERKLIAESRSYPKSAFRAWPSKIFLYHHRENSIDFYDMTKSRKASLLINMNLPILPSNSDAISWWLSMDGFLLADRSIVIVLPDFRARITNVKFTRKNFAFTVEKGTLDHSQLQAKYYLEYDDYSADTGDITEITGKGIEIPFLKTVQKLCFVLCDFASSEVVIDYRSFSWRYPLGDIDIEYEVTEDDIAYWLSLGENEMLEYKLLIDDRSQKEFLETVCSFSNTSGGRIIIGVDDNSNVAGLDSNVDKYLQKIGDMIREWIEPRVTFTTIPISYQNKQLISVVVYKGPDRPYNYKKHGVFIRANGTDRIAGREELLNLLSRNEAVASAKKGKLF